MACLSGQSESAKDDARRSLTALGGTTMGKFDPRYVTHLILDAPVGPKYENYRRHLRSDDWARRLLVVTTSWIDACGREGKRVDEKLHRLEEGRTTHRDDDDDSAEGGRRQRQCALPGEVRDLSSEDKCDWFIERCSDDDDDGSCRDLFSGRSFILAGFEDDDADDGNGGGGEAASGGESSRDDDAEGGTADVHSSESSRLKSKISKLIRGAGGTI